LIQYSKWIIVVFGFLVFGLTQTRWLTDEPYWQKTEGELIDRRYLLRGERGPDPNIVLVGLGTSAFQLDTLSSNEIAASPTLQLMQQPWPWDRHVYAAVLEKLMSGGAKVVMFDFVFAGETEGDDEFAKDLLKYKDHVVIGEMFQDEEGLDTKTKRLTEPNSRLLLSGVGSVAGLVTTWPDPDNATRRARYRTSVERETLEMPGIAPGIVDLLKTEIAGGQAPDNLEHLTLLTAEKFNSNIFVPSPEQFKFIDFQGGSGTYRPLPIENMFVDHLWTNAPFNSGLAFSNKIVVVGPMAEIFHDVQLTPFGEMPGAEIHAQAIAALLHHSWLTGTSPPVNLSFAVLMLLLALGICLFVDSAPWKVFLLAASVVVFFVACQFAFKYHKLVLPMLQPLFCLVVPGAFGIVFQYALEQFERLRYRNVLDRYVSKNVAAAVLEDKRSFEESLRGQKKPVTILFSDIRGFTSMTETSDANKLVAQLNEYFLEMVGTVLKEGGTLQKFIGDAIMAAWGDTHSESLETDAQRAVSAALQMRAALAKLNAQWKDNPDRPKLSIGIGVNHGEVIVGNIGHPQRMEFTVLGDGVNLAARLESATKQFHADILIGEQTEKLTREKFIFRSVGAIAFKGKTEPIEVFFLLGDRSQPAPKWLEKYQDAIKLYRGRKFAEAAALFEIALREIGGKDYLCETYVERCGVYLKEPPPADWDGSYKLTEK
ncbi:MAG TPA: adenylate/guanylate cyclase domain-containing protein, partial [Verrucomicrobiae bacterium]|nr:adenylate/guanylate cyclase domain-containing protein [Verrucomicrobiae bacterium]